MAYDFSELKDKIASAKDWLTKEYQAIRTGRATPAILDRVQVDSYGSKMPVNQVANISVEGATSLRITPWDKEQLKPIEEAIDKADLGVSVQADDQGVRVIFPELTTERREQFTKIIGAKREESLVSIRKAREEVWEDMRRQQKAGNMSEDDMYRLKDQMEEMVQNAQKELKALEEKKIAEIQL